VYTLLFDYFDQNSQHFKPEGIFRKPGNKDIEIQLEKELQEGNYEYLNTVTDPYTIAGYLKKVLRNMGEPLCTFRGYEEFKSMGDDNNSNDVIKKLNTTMGKLPEINRNLFRALLKFLGHVTIFEEDNRMTANNLAIVFAPNIFKPFEMTQNDMIYAVTFVKLLELMILRRDDLTA
jgi:hypothetical protein